MVSKVKKNRRAFDCPEDLDEFIESEMREDRIDKFATWIVRRLYEMRDAKGGKKK